MLAGDAEPKASIGQLALGSIDQQDRITGTVTGGVHTIEVTLMTQPPPARQSQVSHAPLSPRSSNSPSSGSPVFSRAVGGTCKGHMGSGDPTGGSSSRTRRRNRPPISITSTIAARPSNTMITNAVTSSVELTWRASSAGGIPVAEPDSTHADSQFVFDSSWLTAPATSLSAAMRPDRPAAGKLPAVARRPPWARRS